MAGSGNHESRARSPRQNGSRLGPGESEKKMKKAMFGLACAAAMVACADITSSNIVGYNNKDACANFSLAIPMFKDCGLTSVNVQNLIPQGENVSGDGSVSMQTFTDLAETDTMYLWLTEADMGVDVDGWYLDDYTTLAEKALVPGEGFMFYAGNGACQLNFAGEVDLEEKVVACCANFSLLGNFRPLDVDIQTIVPQGENVSGDGSVSMQTFTDLAETDTMYLWLTEADMGVEADGWYLDDYTTLAEKSFAPGEGFMFYAGNGACELKFSTIQK